MILQYHYMFTPIKRRILVDFIDNLIVNYRRDFARTYIFVNNLYNSFQYNNYIFDEIRRIIDSKQLEERDSICIKLTSILVGSGRITLKDKWDYGVQLILGTNYSKFHFYRRVLMIFDLDKLNERALHIDVLVKFNNKNWEFFKTLIENEKYEQLNCVFNTQNLIMRFKPNRSRFMKLYFNFFKILKNNLNSCRELHEILKLALDLDKGNDILYFIILSSFLLDKKTLKNEELKKVYTGLKDIYKYLIRFKTNVQLTILNSILFYVERIFGCSKKNRDSEIFVKHLYYSKGCEKIINWFSNMKYFTKFVFDNFGIFDVEFILNAMQKDFYYERDNIENFKSLPFFDEKLDMHTLKYISFNSLLNETPYDIYYLFKKNYGLSNFLNNERYYIKKNPILRADGWEEREEDGFLITGEIVTTDFFPKINWN